MKRITTCLLAMAALSGCTANLQDLANEGDWVEIGYRD
ncbi:MAG: lipoprotein, partial [Vibrio gallaecicus]